MPFTIVRPHSIVTLLSLSSTSQQEYSATLVFYLKVIIVQKTNFKYEGLKRNYRYILRTGGHPGLAIQ